MATITKGKTFVNGELVTPEKLHQLVDAATLSPLVNADIAANAAIADTKLAQITTAGKVLPAAVQGTAVVTTDSRLSDSRTPTAHTHDDRYYTETEMNTLLAGKQASGSYAPSTGIAPSAITGTAVITTDSRLSDARTPTAHNHDASAINAGTLAIARIPTGNTATTVCIGNDTRLSDARTPTAHNHDDRYYTESEMNTLLAGKQASGSYAPASGIAPSAITGTAVITTDSRLSDARTPIDSSVSFSKLVQAVQETLVPTGSVVAFAFDALAGIPDGWLECNGSAVSRSTYSNLHSKIGVSYGSGDGSTTFNLPDLCGYFIRGSGTNSDGTASGSFAIKQSDDVKAHNHPVTFSAGTCVLSVQEIQGGRSTGSSTTVTDINVSTGFPNVSIAIQTNLGTETRPKNIAMMYCIKT
jgi:microcystin-dependent protein